MYDIQNPDTSITVNGQACQVGGGPAGIDVGSNIMQAKSVQLGSELSSVVVGQESAMEIQWMGQQFPTGGPQDYKTQFRGQGDFTNFGNFNLAQFAGL